MYRYCFFGSSVTEQTVFHSTGETVGYVNYFIQNCTPRDDYEFLRIARGDTSIADAGLLYLNDIINWKPDICILDWCTARIPDADKVSVRYVYQQLLLNNILPVTIVFPQHRNVKKTQIYQEQLASCHYFKTPFIEISSKIPLNKILRDSVHTNTLGGKIYAEELHKHIKKIKINKIKINKNIDLSNSEYIKTKSFFDSTTKHQISDFTIELITENLEKNSEINLQIYFEQMIGPYSPIILIDLIDKDNKIKISYSLDLFDSWCYRERFALKAVTPKLLIDNDIIKIKGRISETAPNYSKLVKEIDPNLSIEKRYFKNITRGFYILHSKKEMIFSIKKMHLKNAQTNFL